MTNDLVQQKTDLTKELYDLIINQAVIPSREEVWFGLTANSEWKGIFLSFTYNKVEFVLRKQIRVRLSKRSKNGIIGEERYVVCNPYKMRVLEIKNWIAEITLHISYSQEKPEVLIQEGEKICSTCKLPHPFSYFHSHKTNSDRLSSDCKGCISIKAKEARDARKKRIFEKTAPSPDKNLSAPTLTDEQKQAGKREFDRNNLRKFLNL